MADPGSPDTPTPPEADREKTGAPAAPAPGTVSGAEGAASPPAAGGAESGEPPAAREAASQATAQPGPGSSSASPAPGVGPAAPARPAPPPRPAPTVGAPSAARPASEGAARPAPAAKPAAHEPPKPAPPSGPPDPPPPPDRPLPAFIQTLQAALPGAVAQISYYLGDWTLIVPPARLVEVARHLRDAPDALFDYCSDVTATDWPPRPARFDVIYHLYSIRHRHRVRVKARVAEHEPTPSLSGIWPAANWLEREVYDMFGVNFTGHPDRRRILMPEDWQGFPERKDYPLEGPGELLMENPLDWLKLRQAREEAEIE